MRKLNWCSLKNFVLANGFRIKYAEDCYNYYILDPNLIFECILNKEQQTEEVTDFETNFKAGANIAEAPCIRLTTNRYGRRLHDRYVSFKTCDPTSINNNDYLGNDYGDVAYLMKDVDKIVTENPLLAEETWLIFEPPFDYEIAVGKIKVPSTLPGDEDYWEIHAVAAPDISEQLGGTVHLIANSHIKWDKGSEVGTEVLSPAPMEYSETYHSNKIVVIVMHPAGATAEFRLNLKMFK